MKAFIAALLSLTSLAAFGQQLPIFLGPVISFFPPATNANGSMVVFGSTVTPQGSPQLTNDLYVGATKLVTNITSVGLISDGSRAFFTNIEPKGGGEAVGTVDIPAGTTRRLNVDTKGCIQPLVVCPACFFSCVVTPHATVDGGKILYAVRRSQPFYTVNTDGTGVTQLPVYSGSLAPSPQRVISAGGLVVFTSAAPFGPTFAASATDVYVMNLDGTNIRNLTNFGVLSAIFSSNATISADGNTILFETNYAVNNSGVSMDRQIWAVQSDGSRLRQLTFGAPAGNPSISADGKIAVFQQAGAIYSLLPLSPPPPSGARVPIASFRYSVGQAPVISDDGQRVAFLLGPSSFAAGAVYQVNIDGTNLHAVYAPRAISPRGVVAAAGLGVPPSPGALLSVYGINFSGDSITGAAGFPLPPVLGGVSVLLDGKALPMLSVSPWQINVHLPQETPVTNANFQVSFDNGFVTPAEVVAVQATGPAVFVTDTQQAAVLHAGTSILADDAHPAKAGEILEMFGTGLGVTDPSVPAGQPAPVNPLAQAKITPVVSINNVDVQVLFAGLAPGFAGVYQVNFVVPTGLKAGHNTLTVRNVQRTVGGSGTITIQ
jgi:uncharacterized protein (TIGR03437 family)